MDRHERTHHRVFPSDIEKPFIRKAFEIEEVTTLGSTQMSLILIKTGLNLSKCIVASSIILVIYILPCNRVIN